MDEPAAKNHHADRADPIERIRSAQQAIEEARAELQAAVDAGREGGLSWDAIGQTLGVTRQSAWERFHQRGSKSAGTERAPEISM